MAEQSQKLPTPGTTGNEPAAAVVAASARWLGFADDVAFGCECADPSLQIERWREEAVLSPANSS